MVDHVDDAGTLAHVPNSQYDADSAPNQNVNCGPTTVTNVAKYHVGRDFPINETRRLATTVNGTGTSISQIKTMLDKRGIPSDVTHLDYVGLKKRLDGTRTFDVAVLMAKIPLAIRRRAFAGTHSLEALCNAVVGGVSGVYVNNPDFRAPASGRTFIPDQYLKAAFDALGGWAVIPSKPRVVTSRTAYKKKMVAVGAVNARSGPAVTFARRTTVASGHQFTSARLETRGGLYAAGTRRDWVSLIVGGRELWVARKYVKEA